MPEMTREQKIEQRVQHLEGALKRLETLLIWPDGPILKPGSEPHFAPKFNQIVHGKRRLNSKPERVWFLEMRGDKFKCALDYAQTESTLFDEVWPLTAVEKGD